MNSVGYNLPYVGRVRERRELRDRLVSANLGFPTVELIAAEPGGGKTRLITEIGLEAKEQGYRVLFGRCYEGEGSPALWPWIQIVRAYLHEADMSRVPSHLLARMGALRPLVPEMAIEALGPGKHPVLEGDETSFRLFDGVLALVEAAAADAPLLLSLYDLQWASEISLQLLVFLCYGMTGLPVVLLGTYRDDLVPNGGHLARSLADLQRLEHCDTIRLTGLLRGEVRDLLKLTWADLADSDADAMATQLHRETDGNPLFLSKLIRDLGEHGELFGMSLRASMSEVVGPEHLPKTIQDSFSQRFEERTADCRQALLAAAVIGRPFDLSLLGQVSGLEGLSLLEAADEAEMARLIQPIEEPGRYRFTHALVRRAIYQEVPRGRLAKLHWRAAEELRKRYGAEVAHVEEIAHHHVEGAVAGDPVEAARWAKAAGDRARALFAFEDATRWYQSALEICELQLDTLAPERVALLLTLGRTYVAAGHLKVASRVLYQAAAAAREAGDVIALAKIALSYPPEGRQFQRFDPTYLALLTEVLSGLPEDQRVLRACVLAKMAIVRVADATQTALQLSEQATELARHVGDATALSAALTARRLAVAGVPGEPDPSTDDELLTVAESTGEPLSIIETRRVRVLERLERADIWGAETEMQAYKSVAARLHQPYHAWQLAIWHAMRTTVSGDFVASDRLISEAYHLGRSLDPDHAFDTFTRQRFSLALLRGTSGEMISELEELTARTLDDQEGVLWRFYLARAYYESGLTDDASRELRTIVTSDFSAGLPPRQFLAKLTLIAPLVASLADERAQRRTLDLLHLFEDKAVVIDDGVAWQGAVSHYIALMERAQGRWTAAYEHLNRALAMYRQANAAPWQAIACLEVARVSTKLGGSSQVANALELASEAKRTAVALKMDRLSAEAGEFLGAGKPDGVQVRSVPFGLSEREVEVLRLLATGHSSREIAGELVISTRTAEHHVQNIYNKTGARRRVDAATLASRLGLGPV